jgi:hypothetical protein
MQYEKRSLWKLEAIALTGISDYYAPQSTSSVTILHSPLVLYSPTPIHTPASRPHVPTNEGDIALLQATHEVIHGRYFFFFWINRRILDSSIASRKKV